MFSFYFYLFFTPWRAYWCRHLDTLTHAHTHGKIWNIFAVNWNPCVPSKYIIIVKYGIGCGKCGSKNPKKILCQNRFIDPHSQCIRNAVCVFLCKLDSVDFFLAKLPKKWATTTTRKKWDHMDDTTSKKQRDLVYIRKKVCKQTQWKRRRRRERKKWKSTKFTVVQTPQHFVRMMWKYFLIQNECKDEDEEEEREEWKHEIVAQ